MEEKSINSKKMALTEALQSTKILLGSICIGLFIFTLLNLPIVNPLDEILTSKVVVSKDINDFTKYPNLEIRDKNTDALKMSGSLINHTSSCADYCESVFTITIYDYGKLIEDVRFYSILNDGSKIEQNIKNYQFYIKTSEKEVDVNNHTFVCEETGKVLINGTKEEKCYFKLIGTYKESVPVWEVLDIEKEFDPGAYTLKIYGKKSLYKNVDWQIKTKEQWLTDWAYWGASVYEKADGNYNSCQTTTDFSGVLFAANRNASISVVVLDIETSGNLPNNLTFWSMEPTAFVDDEIFTAGGNRNINVSVNWSIQGGKNYTIAMRRNSGASFNQSLGGTWSFPFKRTFVNFSNGTYSTDSGGGWPKYGSPFGFRGLLFRFSNVYSNSPANLSYFYVNENIPFNCSAVSYSSLKNITLLVNGVRNGTVSLTGVNIENSTIFNRYYSSIGYNSWICEVCDVDNDCGLSENKTFTVGYFAERSQVYTTPILERTINTFYLNVSYNESKYTNSFAYLNYNGTRYSSTRTGSNNNYSFARSLTSPDVTISTNYSFVWEVVLNNGTDFYVNSTSKQQTVNPFAVDNCTTNNVYAFNFTQKDERTQTAFVGTNQNTTAEVEIQIYSYDRLYNAQNYTTKFNKFDTFPICINSTLSDGSKYSIDMQVRYYADEYDVEFYNIQNGTLDSTHLYQNISLYSLKNDSVQNFKITYKDASLLPVENALIQVQRKYVDEGVFKVVEIPRTDANGETLIHLDLNNIIYTFVVTKNGQVLATFNNMIPQCQNPLLTTCYINLNSYSSTISTTDFTVIDDFSYTIDFNRTSRGITVVYSVPSGSVSTVLLNATKADSLGTTQVCSQSLTSASGTLLCTVPNSFGNGTLYVSLYKDASLIARGSISLSQTPTEIYGSNMIFLTIFLFMTLIGVGVGANPMVTGIFVVFGAIIAVALNLVGTGTSSFIGAGATILWLIIAIIIILIKSSNRQ
jgi:hypothetical protein